DYYCFSGDGKSWVF
nr:immunoglobulin light chain junction region [Macaca mulatta]